MKYFFPVFLSFLLSCSASENLQEVSHIELIANGWLLKVYPNGSVTIERSMAESNPIPIIAGFTPGTVDYVALRQKLKGEDGFLEKKNAYSPLRGKIKYKKDTDELIWTPIKDVGIWNYTIEKIDLTEANIFFKKALAKNPIRINKRITRQP